MVILPWDFTAFILVVQYIVLEKVPLEQALTQNGERVLHLCSSTKPN